MMSDFAPGDVVVCVNDGGGRDPVLGTVMLIKKGRVYRVESVSQRPKINGEMCPAVRVCGVAKWYNEICFRKLNDGTDDAELIERIKSCRPVREGIPA